jgi:threonine/homoserine efflux transporter RhtA
MSLYLNKIGARMWMLVLVLIPAIQGFDRVTLLETLQTEEECAALRTIVIEGMTQAYPGDTSYSIECRKQEK